MMMLSDEELLEEADGYLEKHASDVHAESEGYYEYILIALLTQRLKNKNPLSDEL